MTTQSPLLASPVPLSDIEDVLAWVDSFKLSKPTKKINRDFSDAVLLAEILAAHYPKLVEMHNYPPRNSHALKLNNWMTLNRKVLKRLKLNLCTNTMDQLANSVPGVIERVLIMVRDKIRRDEELDKSTREAENNMSSGGSYYEACGDDEGVLVVPVKTRVNGVLETIQQKVVNYEVYSALKEELKDAKDTADILRQKVEHLDSLLKLKDERITELQKQLDRKQARRKEIDALQNSINAPFEEPPSPILTCLVEDRKSSLTKIASKTDELKVEVKLTRSIEDFSKISSTTIINPQINHSGHSIPDLDSKEIVQIKLDPDLERINSDVFKEATDYEFTCMEPVVTIEETIYTELDAISRPNESVREDIQEAT